MLVIIIIVVLTIIQYILPAHSKIVNLYNTYIFHPFQSARNIIFSIIPFSVGDLVYVIGGIMLLYLFIKWLFYVSQFRKYKHQLGNSLLQTLIVLGIVYILFMLGWGGNYYKPSLSKYWNLDRKERTHSNDLETFDNYLVTKLNEYASGYRDIEFKEIDRNAKAYFKIYTDSRTRNYGVKAKASLFGYLMQHFGIQGYYNPWTGEAQVNKYLPSFMLPFVVCHEMAHQSGIAAEDDANLLSYVVSTIAPDSVFRYSAYLNLWLYTHARFRKEDSSKARQLRSALNPTTLAHLDILKNIRKKYNSNISDYSGALYDGYLKLHHQKDGIESYNKVAITAWAWEQRSEKDSVITIP